MIARNDANLGTLRVEVLGPGGVGGAEVRVVPTRFVSLFGRRLGDLDGGTLYWHQLGAESNAIELRLPPGNYELSARGGVGEGTHGRLVRVEVVAGQTVEARLAMALAR